MFKLVISTESWSVASTAHNRHEQIIHARHQKSDGHVHILTKSQVKSVCPRIWSEVFCGYKKQHASKYKIRSSNKVVMISCLQWLGRISIIFAWKPFIFGFRNVDQIPGAIAFARHSKISDLPCWHGTRPASGQISGHMMRWKFRRIMWICQKVEFPIVFHEQKHEIHAFNGEDGARICKHQLCVGLSEDQSVTRTAKKWPFKPSNGLMELRWGCVKKMDGILWFSEICCFTDVYTNSFAGAPESHGYSTLFSFLKWPHVGISSVLRQTTFSHEETKSVGINPYKSSISGSVKSPYSSRLWMIMVDHIFIHPFNYPVSVLSISIDLVNHHI